MWSMLKKLGQKLQQKVKDICDRALEVEKPKQQPMPKPTKVPLKLELVPVPVTHWVPQTPSTPSTPRETLLRNFKEWQDNNRLLFG